VAACSGCGHVHRYDDECGEVVELLERGAVIPKEERTGLLYRRPDRVLICVCAAPSVLDLPDYPAENLAAQKFSCERCGAAVGESCHTPSTAQVHCHAVRFWLAVEAGYIDRIDPAVATKKLRMARLRLK
jgi:hypothetical protein